jgi:predicted Rossmann-fold nucleotide-binding protein
MPIILYGKEFWEDLINFEQFIKWGVISPKDVELFKIVDDVNDAFSLITSNLSLLE